MLSSVSKVGRVLGLFTRETPEWGVSQVALRLGIAKSSAHALLVTLDDIGLVRRLPDGRYRLGWRILELNHTLRTSVDFLGPSRARLQQLADGLEAIVHVAGLRDQEIVYLERIVGRRCTAGVDSGVGMAMPAHRTALGKVMLAALGGPAEALPTSEALRRRTGRTITTGRALQDELDRVRLTGYAVDHEEAVAGVCCLAAPIRDRNGAVEAAVSLTLPASRFRDREQLLPGIVRSAAGEISRNRRGEPLAHVG